MVGRGQRAVEPAVWKTRWRKWKSTRKMGAKAGLFHFFHRVFNLWKRKCLFYKPYSTLLWKTSASVQNRGITRPAPGRMRRGGARKTSESLAKRVGLWYTLP